MNAQEILKELEQKLAEVVKLSDDLTGECIRIRDPYVRCEILKLDHFITAANERLTCVKNNLK